MLSNKEFVTQSLELNLFFMRIAKEHSIFMEAAFMKPNSDLIYQAEMLKNIFTSLLRETLHLSYGNISHEVATSGELVTDLTFCAERETEYFTGINIDSRITSAELYLACDHMPNITPSLVRQVELLNYKAVAATNQIIRFKSKVLQDVLKCKIFTTNYPLLIDHILREAHLYLKMLTKLQKREELNMAEEIIYQETFWSRIMAEHAKFIRGLLDPTEVKLFDTANNFGDEFDKLTMEAQKLAKDLKLIPEVTEETLKATVDIRNFKKQATEGLINCKIKAIAVPLLGDHVTREANHYIRLLKNFKC